MGVSNVGDRLVNCTTSEGSYMKLKEWLATKFKSRYNKLIVYGTYYFDCWKFTLHNEDQ